MTFSLSPGQAHDAPAGRQRLRRLGGQRAKLPVLMYRAYEGTEKGRMSPPAPICHSRVGGNLGGRARGRAGGGDFVLPAGARRKDAGFPLKPVPDVCYRATAGMTEGQPAGILAMVFIRVICGLPSF